MKLLVWQKKENSMVFFRMRFYSMMSHHNLKFFINKTIKYGSLVKMKYQKRYRSCYYSRFVYGFSVYVLSDSPLSRYNEDGIKAVILERNGVQNVSRWWEE